MTKLSTGQRLTSETVALPWFWKSNRFSCEAPPRDITSMHLSEWKNPGFWYFARHIVWNIRHVWRVCDRVNYAGIWGWLTFFAKHSRNRLVGKPAKETQLSRDDQLQRCHTKTSWQCYTSPIRYRFGRQFHWYATRPATSHTGSISYPLSSGQNKRATVTILCESLGNVMGTRLDFMDIILSPWHFFPVTCYS